MYDEMLFIFLKKIDNLINLKPESVSRLFVFKRLLKRISVVGLKIII